MSKRRMTKSKIGYTNEAVPWVYGWNPGGFGCSGGCDGCWARSLAKRFSKCEKCRRFEVHLHEERLCEPANTKKAGVVLKDLTNDWLDPKRRVSELRRLCDTMWAYPRHTFVTLTHRPERLAWWVRHHAYRHAHGWTEWSQQALSAGEYVHHDDMYYRNQCGWVDPDGDWQCRHPDSEDGTCDERSCPIAYCADTREDLRAIGIEDQYEYDDEGYVDEGKCHSEWMRLEARPRNSALRNIWYGLTARTQRELRRALPAVARVKHADPHARLWFSLEPLVGPITFSAPAYWHGDEKGEPINWLAREYRMSEGGHEHPSHYIQGVIVGHDNRRGAPGTDTLDHIRSVVQQCQAAGVPVYVKQLWHRQRCGHCLGTGTYMGGLACPHCKGKRVEAKPQFLRASHPNEYALYPDDLKLRDLPWSMPEAS